MRPLVSIDARPRRYGFALTPLADAMFQLLVFFMLSSSLAPYSLIPLTGGPAGASALAGAAAATPAPAPQPGQEAAVWHLGRGSLRSGGETVPLTTLPALVATLRGAGVTEVVLFSSRAATVQDVATVLESLAAGGIATVRMVAGAGTAPGGG